MAEVMEGEVGYNGVLLGDLLTKKQVSCSEEKII